MRHFLLVAFAFFVACALPSCAQKTNTRKPKTMASAATETGPVITFERTVCFGRCPVYTASVFADGRVEYEGRQNVPVMGKKTLELPSAQVVDMLDQAQNVRFSELKANYSQGVTDVPSTIIAVRQPDGQLKTVTIEGSAPEELQGFVSYLRNQFDPLAGLVTISDK